MSGECDDCGEHTFECICDKELPKSTKYLKDNIKYITICSYLITSIKKLLISLNKAYKMINKKDKPMKKKHSKKAEKKIAKVMKEGYEGKLHSGSKKSPVVTKPKQMKAIAIAEAKKKGLKVPKKRLKK